MTKKSDRASDDSFSLLQTMTAFPPGREDPPRRGRTLSLEKGNCDNGFLDRRAASGNNPVPNCLSSWDKNWTRSYGGFDNPDRAHRAGYIPANFTPRQIRFIVHCPTTTRRRMAIDRKRPRSVRGSRTPIRGLRSARARIVGLRFAKVIASLTRNGKTPGLSAQITGNTFLATNAPNQT